MYLYTVNYAHAHGRCPVSEMTYTVLSGMLNPSIPYHTMEDVISNAAHISTYD